MSSRNRGSAIPRSPRESAMSSRDHGMNDRCCSMAFQKPDDTIDPAAELMHENNRMLIDVRHNLSKLENGTSPWLKESMANEMNNLTEIASLMRRDQRNEFDKFRAVMEDFTGQLGHILDRHEQLVEQLQATGLNRKNTKKWTLSSKSFVETLDQSGIATGGVTEEIGGQGSTTLMDGAENENTKDKAKTPKGQSTSAISTELSRALSRHSSFKDMAKSVVARVSSIGRKSMGRKSKRRRSIEGRSKIGTSSAPWTRDEADEIQMTSSRSEDDVDEVFPMLSLMVYSAAFKFFFAFLIFTNAIFVAIQAQHAADNLHSEAPVHLTIFDMVYCVLFLFEISCRMLVERGHFFWSSMMYWNIFDLALVVLAIQDQVASYVLIAQGEAGQAVEGEDGDGNWSFLRLIRLLRIMRVLRLFKFFPRLTVMLNEILECMSAIVWLCVLLSIVLFVVALVFMSATTNFLRTDSGDDEVRQELRDAFGSLPVALLSLFKVVSGGMLWERIGDGLMEVSVLYGVFFIVYLAFVVFGIVNVVTGIFVTSAQKTAKTEEEEEKQRILVDLKLCLDEFSSAGDDQGVVNREMFTYYLEAEDKMKQLLKPLNIVPADASHMFDLLMDHDTKVTNNRLTKGLCRLLGGAKGTDLVFLLFETRRLADELFGFFCFAEANFRTISTAVGVKNGERRYLASSPSSPRTTRKSSTSPRKSSIGSPRKSS